MLNGKMTKKCLLSVVIPVYNEQAIIKSTLNNIENQKTVLGDKIDTNLFEVIIVNNNSTDKTKNIIEKFALKSKINIVIIKEKNKGICSALRTGFKYATKRSLERDVEYKNYSDYIIARTDADTIVDNAWIDLILKNISSKKQYITGGTEWDLSHEKFQHMPNAKKLAEGILKTYNKMRKDFFPESFGGNIAFSRSAYLKVGYLDHHVTHEDVAFGYNFQLKGIDNHLFGANSVTSARRIIKNANNFLLLKQTSGGSDVEVRDDSDHRIEDDDINIEKDITLNEHRGVISKWVSFFLISFIINPLILFPDFMFKKEKELKLIFGKYYKEIINEVLQYQNNRPLNVYDYDSQLKTYVEQGVQKIIKKDEKRTNYLINKIKSNYSFL